MKYNSIQDILNICEETGKPFWRVIMEEYMQESAMSETSSFEKMREMYRAMADADRNYDAGLKSESRMTGGDGQKLHEYNEAGRNLCGDFVGLAMEKAIKMGESNACMRRIVAAPTAGACGVIPAVLLSYQELYHAEEDRMVEAMFTAAGIGNVIAMNAYIAGASGGCQAEIGSASAMAAGALCYLQGGTNGQIASALSFALKNMLGLTCDPVMGLVEVPCVKRNSAGAVNAIAATQLAMAGIVSAISPDDVIDSMRRIGNAMSPSLKETGEGGLAATASAQKFMQSEP